MKRLLWVSVVSLSVMAVACASKDDGGADEAQATREVEPYQPKGNGERVTEAEACERMVGALDDRASDLGCVITYPSCPQYLRQSTAGACYDYDEGTISSCVDFIGKYQDCEDFRRRPCIVTYFKDSVCEESEPGDGGLDDAETSDAEGDEDAG